MKQVAEEGQFVEYKRITDYWTDRIEGVKLPAEIVFLVGASPYRFTAVSIDKVELSTVPEYAREIISKTPGGGFVYGITCKPITPTRAPAQSKQLQLTSFSPAPGPIGAPMSDFNQK